MIDVKLIRILTGEEIVAEIVTQDDLTVTVKNALVVIPSQSGVGFASWATVIARDEPEIVLNKEHIIYSVKVQEEVYSKYNEMFGSKLITPAEKKLVL